MKCTSVAVKLNAFVNSRTCEVDDVILLICPLCRSNTYVYKDIIHMHVHCLLFHFSELSPSVAPAVQGAQSELQSLSVLQLIFNLHLDMYIL